jgi:hypothetical protein
MEYRSDIIDLAQIVRKVKKKCGAQTANGTEFIDEINTV